MVVGSGIVGASTAYHLAGARAGGADVEVTVVDARHDGKATLAGAGIICPWPSAMEDGPYFDLYAAGAKYYDELIGGLAALGHHEVGYRRSGALVVSDDATQLDAAYDRIERRAAGRPEVGDFVRVTAPEAQALFPPLRSATPGIHISGGARVDGRLLANALLDAASAQGATIVEGSAELVVEQDAVTGVRCGAEQIEADAVVVAGGAWTNELLGPLGAAVDVEPQKGQIVHLELAGVDTSGWPSLLPIGPKYLVPFDAGRIVVGATRETGSGFETRVTAAGQAEVLDAGLAIAPGLADARVIETRVGLRPLAHGSPTIGAAPGIAGLFIGTGMGAAGLTIGPVAGRRLADAILS